MTEMILVVNAGSSSIKFQLFEVHGSECLERQMRGQIEGIGTHPKLVARASDDAIIVEEYWPAEEVPDLAKALEHLIPVLRQQCAGKMPVAVGHRVVHGGLVYSGPTIVDKTILEYLEKLTPFAPLHQPNNLAPIRILLKNQPQIVQVACFDTAFHRSHPVVADRFALPDELYAEGVRRYGFHGLSYEYIALRLRQIAPEIAHGRIVIAHLGSGASMCAIRAGKSVESTTGFTALDGLPMGTRPGQLDPGVLLYLMTEKQMDAKAIEHYLYHECGLKGLSGVSSDMRDLLKSSDAHARLAIDYFVYRIALYSGMLTAALEGIDGFVFTAGIGENSATIRKEVLQRIAWLGITLDEDANIECKPLISEKRSRIPCYIIQTDEELMIAKQTLSLLRAPSVKSGGE